MTPTQKAIITDFMRLLAAEVEPAYFSQESYEDMESVRSKDTSLDIYQQFAGTVYATHYSAIRAFELRRLINEFIYC